MGLSRTSPLLTTAAEVAALTAVQNADNIAAAAQVTVAQALAAAHKWVFDRLRRRFSAAQLATLTNTEALEYPVAARFVGVGFASGVVVGDAGARAAEQGGRGFWLKEAEDGVDAFSPEFASYDSPRRSDEGIPSVGHVDSGPTFSGGFGTEDPGYFFDGTPEVL